PRSGDARNASGRDDWPRGRHRHLSGAAAGIRWPTVVAVLAADGNWRLVVGYVEPRCAKAPSRRAAPGALRNPRAVPGMAARLPVSLSTAAGGESGAARNDTGSPERDRGDACSTYPSSSVATQHAHEFSAAGESCWVGSQPLTRLLGGVPC